MARVIVVGSINDDVVVTAARLPGPGETVHGTDVAHSAGGKGANQAVAAARAGADVAMVGCVGDDEAGRRLCDGLAGAGVAISTVGVVAGVPTGVAVVTVADGENCIVVVPGANGHLAADAVAEAAVAAGDVVVAQMETPLATTAAAFARARQVGAVTVLNPAPAAAVPADVLDLVDHLVVNEHEVELVTGVAASDLVAPATRADAVVRLRAVTGAVVHLTLGAEGALVLPPDGEAVAVPGHRVEVVDSTGAGDCVVGTLAAGLAAGVPVADAAVRAGAAAALSVTRPGAAPAMPTAAEVDALLA